MALKGTIKGSTNNQYIDAKIEWSATQSVDGNYSTVTATLYYSRNNTGYTTYGTWSGKITINGTQTSSSGSLEIKYNSNTKAISASVKVPHNADGTKTITISASGSISGTSLSSTSVSGSITLDTIPRSSSVSMSAATMDSASTITITRASSSFTHTLSYTFGSKTVTIATKTTSTSISWTPKVSDFAAQIPSATSGTGTLTCTTYNGSTSIGSSSINVKLSLPSSVKPSLTSLTLTPSEITLVDPATGAATSSTVSILMQKKNKLTLKASGATAGTGSTIAYYTFSGPSYSDKVTSTSTSATASISSVSSTGTLTYKVTVTDARGVTSDAITKTIDCYAYSTPSITLSKVYRANSDGTQNAGGAYLSCTYTQTYSTVNDTNAATITAHYNGQSTTTSGGSVLIDLNGDTSTTYNFYLTIRDKYGGYDVTATKVIYGDFRVFNVTKDGTGFALGKRAETSNLLESRWPAKINGKISFGETSIQGSIHADQNDEHDCIVYLMTNTNNPTGGANAGIAIHESSVYVPNKENSGTINLGSSGRMWNQLYAANGTINTSDRNKKTDITPMSSIQEELFNELKPVTYKFIDGASNRTHYGFISQDIEESLDGMGLSGIDFAGFCKDKATDDNGKVILDKNKNVVYDYSLRYSEFIALNTHMIQKLQNEVSELRSEIDRLKSTV